MKWVDVTSTHKKENPSKSKNYRTISVAWNAWSTFIYVDLGEITQQALEFLIKNENWGTFGCVGVAVLNIVEALKFLNHESFEAKPDAFGFAKNQLKLL